jgi:hypothetical protein
MLHTDTMLRSVLKAENPHESDSFVMKAHANRKSPTARARLPTPAHACPPPAPRQPTTGSTRKHAEARGSTQLNAYR